MTAMSREMQRETTRKIEIILADDHAVLRAGLKLLLNNESDLAVVGEAADGEALLALLEKRTADVLIIDLSMPKVSGLECIREIHERGYGLKILVLTMHDAQYLKEAMQAGALGYVEKQALDIELFVAVRTVAAGQRYLSPNHAESLLNSLLVRDAAKPAETDDPYRLLSAREREVLKLIVRGHSMMQIGERLCLSVKTIDTYKTRVMEKLDCTRKSQLVEYAIKHGLLKPE
jgi:DNA-binding NarL/FixJ family response regulator